MTFRYLLLSPTASDRQALLSAVFGTFELAPKGQGEMAHLKEDKGGTLEVVGAGSPSKLFSTARKLLESAVQIHGVLMVLSSGDEESWEEARELTQWLDSRKAAVPLKTWVMGDPKEVDRETSRKVLAELMDEHQRVLRKG